MRVAARFYGAHYNDASSTHSCSRIWICHSERPNLARGIPLPPSRRLKIPEKSGELLFEDTASLATATGDLGALCGSPIQAAPNSLIHRYQFLESVYQFSPANLPGQPTHRVVISILVSTPHIWRELAIPNLDGSKFCTNDLSLGASRLSIRRVSL